MNASIGFRSQSCWRTWGVGGLLGAMNAQCGCHFAPSAIQRLIRSISAVLRVFPDLTGGIRSESSSAVIRW